MTPPARANAFAAYDLVRGIPQAAYVRRGYAATANLAVPATIFRALGGFDARRFSGGDAAFCRRAGAAGHAITLVPDAVVSHPCRTGWDEIATKARRTKGGQIRGGSLPRRVAWTLRTLSPPLRDTLAYLRAPFPARDARHGGRRAVRDLGRGARRDGPASGRRRAGAAVIAAPSSPRHAADRRRAMTGPRP